VLDFKEAVRLVRNRGKFMQEAVPVGKGGMAALLFKPGTPDTDKEVLKFCKCVFIETGKIIEPANFNSDDQIVVAGEKDAIEKAVADLKEVIGGEDAESIKAKTNELSQAAMKLGEAMYKAQQETAGGGDSGNAESPNASNPDNASDEKVVDATFEEVDGEDKKKAS
jgi:malonyl CoA-acyl carrier protein transacylase